MKTGDSLQPVRVNNQYLIQRLVTVVEYGMRKEQFAPVVKALEILQGMIGDTEEAAKPIEFTIVDARKRRNADE